MKKLRIAHAGADHTHYPHFLEYTAQMPYAEIAGVFDARLEKAKKWADVVPGTRVYGSYQEILEDSTVDGIVITANPFLHEEYIIAAAKAGKHCYAEQPLAVSVEAAERIRDAVKASGIHFALANPVKKPKNVFAKKLADSGLLGDLLQVRYRGCHDNGAMLNRGDFEDFRYCYDPKLNAGGSMTNMGSHGVKLLRWFLGNPVSVTSQFTYLTDLGQKNHIDENAVVVFKFENGALGIVESGWVHPRFQGSFEVHGTMGSVVDRPDGIYFRLADDSRGWVHVPDKLLSSGVPHTVTYWMERIWNNLPDEEYGIDEAVDLQKMICAAYEADGKEVKLDFGFKGDSLTEKGK